MQFNHTEQHINLLKENFITEINESINDIVFDTSDIDIIFKCYLQSLLKTEFELFLKSNNGEYFKNGYSSKSLKTTHGEIQLKVPRDRNNEFKSEILTTNSPCTKELSNAIIKLYQLGLSNKDVCEYINDIYGVTYSKQSISNLTKVTSQLVFEFNNRAIDDYYVAIFIDATYIPIKFDNTFEKRGLHLVVGINRYGHQEILGYTIGFQEQNFLWAELLDDLKSRGLKTVDIFISDGFVGLDNVIRSRFPTSKIQRCTVHLIRNIISKVSNLDSLAIKADFTNLFRFTEIDEFNIHCNYLIDKYKKYSHIKPILEQDNIMTYIQFPKLMHRTIKTNNRIESVNQKIKTRIRFKQNFPDQESFERILVASIISQNNKSNKPVGGLLDYLKDKKANVRI